jgi:hypothetical protein
MKLLRRFTAALSSILLLQLSLLGSGTLCALQHSGAHGATDHASVGMAAMAHGASGVGNAAAMDVAATEADTPVNGCDTYALAGSCGGPWSGGTCSSMSSCASSQTVTVAPLLAWVPRAAATVPPEPGTLHAAPAPAPELPPPRA